MITMTFDLDAMIDAYIDCALWSSHNDLFDTSTCDKCETRVIEVRNSMGVEWRDAVSEMDADCPEGGAHEVADPEEHSEMLDGDYDAGDITDETRESMREDCAGFAESNAADLDDMDPGQAGHDFWLTRNGHGAGFWDRGLGARGARLSDAARVYGEVYLSAYDGTISGV